MIDEHRAAFEYDWRTRFHVPLTDIGESMSWGEAYRLSLILLVDPSSQLCAAVRQWTHPIDREDMVLRELYDSFARVHFKKPPPFPRPWHVQPRKIGSASLSAEEYQRLVLRASGQN